MEGIGNGESSKGSQQSMSTSKRGAGGGVQDIAQQLQNLLQIPAIKKKGGTSAPIIDSSSPSKVAHKFRELPIGNVLPGAKVVPRYRSELNTGIPPWKELEGKENSYLQTMGRGVEVDVGKGPPINIAAMQKKPPLRPIEDKNVILNMVKRKHFSCPVVSIYMKDLESNRDEYEGKYEFPGFLDFMHRNALGGRGVSLPRAMTAQDDLIGRNVVKLEGVSNVANYYDIMDHAMKTLLRAHYVEPLSRRVQKFPKAKFFCNLCSHYSNDLLDIVFHVADSFHIKLTKDQSLAYTMDILPMASDPHCEAIGESILDICARLAITKKSIAFREEIVKFLSDLFPKNGVDCEVNMFGSSASGIGFKSSDCNVNVSFPTKEEHLVNIKISPTANPTTEYLNNVVKIAEILESVSQFKNFTPKYHNNKSQIKFTAMGPDSEEVGFLIQFNNKPAYLLGQLLQEYVKINSMVKPLLIGFRYWARMCNVDKQDDGFLPPHAYPIMGIQFLQEAGICPVLHSIPHIDTSRPFATAEETFKVGFPDRSDRKFTTVELGKTWLSLMYYYAVKFDHSRVVAISRTDIFPITLGSNWNRNLSIEDPILPLSNISKATANNKICDYIYACFKTSFMHFAIPCTKKGPLYDRIYDDRLMEDGAMKFKYRNIFESNGELVIEAYSPTLKTSQEGMKHVTSFKVLEEDCDLTDHGIILRSYLPMAHTSLTKEMYNYDFSSGEFRADNCPDIGCKACGSQLHARSECPDETLPPMFEVKRPDEKSLQVLRKVIINNFEKLGMTPYTYRTRLQVKAEVYATLLKDFPDVQLTMFGSSENGFGLKGSDLDLCMTLKNVYFPTKDDVIKYIDENDTLAKVVRCLKLSPNLVDVYSIDTAKVPIVKYKHEASGLDGDICFYNLLALRNTLLLKAYTQLDIRVKVLGCLLKKLGKICEISDASKGSLSSYAYMLMLIHYLQHTEIPVLPVLQELPPIGHPPSPLPTFIVESFDSYYFSDITQISSVWKYYGQNTSTVEELWLGFLRYYTTVFDFDNHVVSIARFAPLTRREKAWFTDCIAIEDPFVKTHNLGSGLTRRMSVHIIKALRRFSKVFNANGNGVDVVNAALWYFNKTNLREGKLPIDRQCHRCHRIGHIARHCNNEDLRRGDVDLYESYDEGEEDEEPEPEGGSFSECGDGGLESINFFQPPPPAVAPQIEINSGHNDNRIIDDCHYFVNVPPGDNVEAQLQKMIQGSTGVSFSGYLKRKAVAMKQPKNSQTSCELRNNNIPPGTMNGMPPLNGRSNRRQLSNPPLHYALMVGRYALDSSQPEGSISCVVPPPGFAPRIPLPYPIISNLMNNNGHPMVRFAGYGLPQPYLNPNGGEIYGFPYNQGHPHQQPLQQQSGAIANPPPRILPWPPRPRNSIVDQAPAPNDQPKEHEDAPRP